VKDRKMGQKVKKESKKPKTATKGKRYRCAGCRKRSPKPIKAPAPWYCPTCNPEPIKYPTFKISGEPTPNDTLYVCDVCRKAAWGFERVGLGKGNCCNTRMREGTPTEYKEAKRVLKEVI
jgi:ribosomal protein L37AE/L43A